MQRRLQRKQLAGGGGGQGRLGCWSRSQRAGWPHPSPSPPWLCHRPCRASLRPLLNRLRDSGPGQPCIPAQPHLSVGPQWLPAIALPLPQLSPLLSSGSGCKAPQLWGLQGSPRGRRGLLPGGEVTAPAPHRTAHSWEPDIFVVFMPLAIMKEVSVFLVINLSLRNSPPSGERGYRGALPTLSVNPHCVSMG